MVHSHWTGSPGCGCPTRGILLRVSLGLVTCLWMASCAIATGERVSRDSDIITEAELSRVMASNLYVVVQRLRPLWLQSRGARSVNLTTEIAVVQNGSYIGPVESLRILPMGGVREIRFLSGGEAVAQVSGIAGGGRHVEAAILIRTGVLPSDP